MRTSPVEHLRFLFRPASIWSHSGRSENFPGRALTFSLSSSEHLVSQRTQCEKISGQAPIFFFPVSSFCSASIWSRSVRSENFPGRALTFSLSSSEHLVSQRTQCEKISRSSSHFPLSPFPLSVQRAFGLAAHAVRTFPVEHLRFLFRPASIWSHSGRSVRKSPGRALIFLFPRFLFLSSEHSVSQRTQ